MIIIGADHAGLALKDEVKKYLLKNNFEVVDVGAYEYDGNDNFPKYIVNMVKCFKENPDAKIISCCGSGIGMSIGLNKNKGIFCAVGHTVKEVKMARLHNDINAIALSGKKTSPFKAKRIVKAFLSTGHIGGKYKKRMMQVDALIK